MKSERKKAAFIFVFLNSLLLVCTLIFSAFFTPKDIVENGKKYTCFFQKNFNLYCPGCGGTRSLGYLYSFDFGKAFLFYPPIFVGIFLILYFDVLLFISFLKNDTSILSRFKYFEIILIPISIIITFITRNLFLYFGIDFLGDILK